MPSWGIPFWELEDFPCGSADKESPCDVGDLGPIPGLGRSPGEGKGYPLKENTRILGRIESNTTERLSLNMCKVKQIMVHP